MNGRGAALDWNGVIERDGAAVLLPEGVYPFDVVAVERLERAQGRIGRLPDCGRAALTLEVDGGGLGKVVLRHSLPLHSGCEGALCAFFAFVGLRCRGEKLAMDWSRVPGARGFCWVTVRRWEEPGGAVMARNGVSGFLESSDGRYIMR